MMGIKRQQAMPDNFDLNGGQSDKNEMTMITNNNVPTVSNQAALHKKMTRRDSERSTVSFADQTNGDADNDDTESGPIVQVIENTDKKWAVSLKVARIFIEHPEHIKVKVSKKTITIRSQIDHDDKKISYLKVIQKSPFPSTLFVL